MLLTWQTSPTVMPMADRFAGKMIEICLRTCISMIFASRWAMLGVFVKGSWMSLDQMRSPPSSARKMSRSGRSGSGYGREIRRLVEVARA